MDPKAIDELANRMAQEVPAAPAEQPPIDLDAIRAAGL